ncbi:hypothetical protein [Desulfovibrio gilichinskyi]|uniref:Uncharacterized protein n=1 Tax=Desulfovibrio gilichinskyi TaxID=1519643 RepID=A0A1X7CS66_9BACT|nr:hypothetical protein [Desulfovibrio gilichinskyi]SMF01794.1 hypothetical protein SAMN06295933_1159 [Desulfovibrio gilichinskyi]
MLKKILNMVLLLLCLLTIPSVAGTANSAVRSGQNSSAPSPFSFSGSSGSYKLGDSVFSLSAPGALTDDPDDQNSDPKLHNTEFSYKIDNKVSATVLSTNYLLDKELVEFGGKYKWLGMDDRWAGVADITGSSNFLQLSTSHAFLLSDDTGEGLGLMRFSLAYLEKEIKQDFDFSGTQKYRMPQYNIGAKYEKEFEPIEDFYSVFEGSYNYYYADGASLIPEKAMAAADTTTAFVGFGGGSQHVAKIRNNFGNDWFKVSGGLGIEYTQFNSVSDVDLGREDVARLTTELGGTVNVLDWLQLDSGWKWSDMQSVYRGGINADAGPAVVAFKAKKVENRFAVDDERLALELNFPLWDIVSFFKGDLNQAFRGDHKKLNFSDNLKFSAENPAPVRFSSAMTDAGRVEGSADKVIKVHRFKERSIAGN